MKRRLLAGIVSVILVATGINTEALMSFAADNGSNTAEISAMGTPQSSILTEFDEESDREVITPDDEKTQEEEIEKTDEEEVSLTTPSPEEELIEEDENIDEDELIDTPEVKVTEGELNTTIDTAVYDYTITADNTIKITKYKGMGPEVVIPDESNGVPVTVIGENAFKDNDTITSVTLPSGLVAIEDYAFYECSKLERVVFNKGLQTTGKYSFGYCSKLEEAILPVTLQKLGDQVFAYCTSLTKVFVPAGLEDVDLAPFRNCSSLKTVVFEEGITRLPGTTRSGIYKTAGLFSESGIEEIVIPDTVETIGVDAFMNCDSLVKVTFPTNLKTIEQGAFSGCDVLEKAILPKGLVSLQTDAFIDCVSLCEVFLPNTIESFGDRIFQNTTNLKKIVFEEGTARIPGGNPVYENYGIFKYCGVEEITIPESVTVIDDCAFGMCEELKKITLSPNITLIGEKAFFGCKKLDGVVLPEGIKVIKAETFMGCSSLTVITIPANVNEVRTNAFAKCASLGQIYFPKNVEKIHDGAFSGCTALTLIEFEVHNLYTSEQILGEGVFKDCTSLTSVHLGNRIKKIPADTFSGCISLNEIQIPHGVTTVSKGAFAKCHNLEILFVPASVTAFGTTDTEFERSYNHVPLVYVEKGPVTTAETAARVMGWDIKIGIWNVNYNEAGNEFPDKNFNNELYAQAIDINIDTRLTLREIERISELDISGRDIKDVKGLELLTSLEKLSVSDNSINTFDIEDDGTKNALSSLALLKDFDLSSNLVSIIDLSDNKALEKLNLDNNRILALDLSSNKKIYDLTLGDQQGVCTLTSNRYYEAILNLKQTYKGQYDEGDVSDITDEYLLEGEEAIAETEGIVWDKAYQTPDDFTYKYTVHYGNGATSKMNVAVTLTNAGLDKDSELLVEAYPDGNFRTPLFAALDKNKNEKISRTEERSLEELNVAQRDIESLTGIERLWSLKTLNAEDNLISEVSLSNNKELTILEMTGNRLTSLDLKNNTKLEKIYVSENALAAIDISALTALKNFRPGKQILALEGTVDRSTGIRTIDIKSYDAAFNKDGVKAGSVVIKDSDGKVLDAKEYSVEVTDTGFEVNSEAASVGYKWTTAKGDMDVTVSFTPVVVPKFATVSFYIGDTLIKTEKISEGDNIADIIPADEDIIKAIPQNAEFIGWYIKDTETLWDKNSGVYQDLILVAGYVLKPEITPDQKSGREPGINALLKGYDEKTGTYYYDAFMVKGQTYALSSVYEALEPGSDRANTKTDWKTTDKKIISVSGKYKISAKKDTGAGVVKIYDGATLEESTYVYDVKVVSPFLANTDKTAYKKTQTLTPGKKLTLTVSGFGAGDALADHYSVSWYSSNSEIADVADGVVTAYTKGSTKITAYVNGKAYTGTVKVADIAKVDNKVGEEATVDLTALQTITLKSTIKGFKASNLVWTQIKGADVVPMTAYDSKGNKNPAKAAYYQNNVVRIYPNGKLIAVGVGSTIIQTQDVNGKIMKVTVNVSEPVANTVYLNVGKTKSLKFYGVKANDGSAVWESSNGHVTGTDKKTTAVKGGKIKAVSAGMSVVTCKYDYYKTGNPIAFKTIVYVDDPMINTATEVGTWSKINKTRTTATLTLKEGDSIKLDLNTKYQTPLYTCSKADIAFVNDGGYLHAKGKGKAKITTKINGKTLTINVVVEEKAKQ